MKTRAREVLAALPHPLVVLDVETTGLSPQQDAILELGACLLGPDLAERDSFHSRVLTTVRISDSAHATHGLTLSDVANAPQLSEVIERFVAFAPPGAILAGHNVAFDVGFLRAAFDQLRRPFPFDYHLMDIWSISYFVLGARAVRLPKHNLNALCGLFGIARDVNHSALQDAKATAAIVRHLAAVVHGDSTIDVLGQFSMEVPGR